jgi:hypothetical protein
VVDLASDDVDHSLLKRGVAGICLKERLSVLAEVSEDEAKVVVEIYAGHDITAVM